MDINTILDFLLVIATTYVMYELVFKKAFKQEEPEQKIISVEQEVQLTKEQIKEAKEQTLYRLYSTFQVKDLSINEAEKLLFEKIQEKPLNRQILIDADSKDSYEAQVKKLSQKYELYKENLKKGLKPDIAFKDVINS